MKEELKLLLQRMRSQRELSVQLHACQQGRDEGSPSYRKDWRRAVGRTYLCSAGLMLLALPMVDACTPAPSASAMRVSTNYSRQQALEDTAALLSLNEQA